MCASNNNGNFTIADVKHEEVKFDKPIYLGATTTITELAKLSTCTGSTTAMWCHIHWGRDRVQLLMTDTDSLMLKVKTKDIWADIKAFNSEHENWIEDEGNPRNGQLGVFKSETGKDPIISFVGLRAKMYSFVTESDHKEHMKAKGCFQRSFVTPAS